MSVSQKHLNTILNRFSVQREAVKQHYSQSETFKTICDDYEKCIEALLYWNHSEDQKALLRRQEYKMLLKELEKEICRYLGEPEK